MLLSQVFFLLLHLLLCFLLSELFLSCLSLLLSFLLLLFLWLLLGGRAKVVQNPVLDQLPSTLLPAVMKDLVTVAFK